jgi:4-amino-4-deoxy-L-arabinose transferase-like glycosyltransferase
MTVWLTLKVALAFALIWMMGYAVIGTAFPAAKRREGRNVFAPVERFFLALMLGGGALTALLAYMSFLGMPLRFRYSLVAVLVVLIPWLWWLHKKDRLTFDFGGVLETLRRAIVPGKSCEGVVRTLVLLVIIYQCAFVASEALMRPFNQEDAMGFWALSVNMIQATHRLPPPAFASGSHYYTTLNNATLYPPMLYLLGYWVSSAAGSVSAGLCKTLLIAYFIGFLALFYYALRRITSQIYSLIFTAFLGLTPVISRGFTIFYADAFITAALSLGMIYLYLYFISRERHMLLLSSLFFALTAWLKVEGTIYFLLAFATLVVFLVCSRGESFRRKLGRVILFSIVPLLLIVPYYAIRMEQKGSHYFIMPGGKLRTFERPKEEKPADTTILPQIYENLASYRPFIYQYRFFQFSKLGDWLFVWAALVFALFISPSRIFKTKVFYLIFYLLLFFWFHYYFAVMLGPVNPAFHFSRGFARHFMHGTGFALLIIAVLLYPHELTRSVERKTD